MSCCSRPVYVNDACNDWKPGTQVILRGIAHNKVWIVHPVTVVQDSPDLLVVQLVPGTLCKIPAGLIDRKYSGNGSGHSRWDEQDSREWQMRDWIWQHRRALILLPSEKYYAVYWFWLDSTDEFEGWYVNFQLPFRRTRFSIDTLDLEIDLIIRPDYTHQWKDEAEYLEGVKRGSIAAGVAGKVEKAREEVLNLAMAKSPLFDPRWFEWRPDPAWEIPQLHPSWNAPDIGITT